MTSFDLSPRLLEEALREVALRVREMRGLLLVDQDGLPLVSTLGAREFEEGLAAFTGLARDLVERAGVDFRMGPVHVLRIAGRDRQIFVVPVLRDMSLIAVVESSATPSAIETHLLALARSILLSLVEPHPTDAAPAAGGTEETPE